MAGAFLSFVLAAHLEIADATVTQWELFTEEDKQVLAHGKFSDPHKWAEISITCIP